MMKIPAPETVLRILSATVLVALFTMGLLLIRDHLNDPLVALVFLLPVMASTALWGLWPGIAASLTAFLMFNYFFIEPHNTLVVRHTRDFLALLVFLVVAAVISRLVGQAQAGQSAANAREREATWLHEIGAALAGIQQDEAIVQVLADQCQQFFQAQVQISLERGPGLEPLTIRRPAILTFSENAHVLIVPVQMPRSLLGEICLWREEPAFTPGDERLLRAYANQGGLALERARLAQTATRAQVLEESDQLKTALLNSVSHELRTPLATIKASVSSLRSGAVDWSAEARSDLLAAIEEETDRLNQLVGDLLNMSRIEAGALKPQTAPNMLAEIAGAVIARMRHKPLSCTIVNDIPDDLPLVPADYALIEQVFVNMLGNSLKYATAGSVIHLRAYASDAAVLVEISNQGPLLPESELERIFDKFYRVSLGQRIAGTGLGLSICKGIIEAHGGQIWAENAPRQAPTGVAFYFTLPIHER